MIKTRRAAVTDTAEMAALLNEIIESGGTTALVKPVTGQDLAEKMSDGGDLAVWHAAFDGDALVGFQWIGPHANLPTEAADIATFVKQGQTGLGIGSALFNATSKAAKKLGYVWINATIRADNEGGLTYYQSRGFRDWAFDEGVSLANGMVVDKISKRYDL